jgi:hypothetical protein
MIWRLLRILFFIIMAIPLVLEQVLILIPIFFLWLYDGKDRMTDWTLKDPALTFMIKVDKWLQKKTAGMTDA